MLIPSLIANQWQFTSSLSSRSWECGHCGHKTTSDRGYYNRPASQLGVGQQPTDWLAEARPCAHCGGLTFFAQDGLVVPGSLEGTDVEEVPDTVGALYLEARQAARAGAHTAAVMVCRTILMHVAVDKGAPLNQTFATYISWLYDNHYLPPDGQGWVDYVRKRGNAANHEIVVMISDDSRALIHLTGSLLRFVYELPSLVPASAAPVAVSATAAD